MLRVCGAGKLTTGASSEDWRRHTNLHVNEMRPLYHTGKNGVKASGTLSRLLENSVNIPNVVRIFRAVLRPE